MRFPPLILVILLPACAPHISRQQVTYTAYRYTQVRWTPEERHVRHGVDSKGIVVKTPDRTISAKRGWWRPGHEAVSMPYQWGGFDTPETFLKKIQMGYKAGDIGDATKRQLGDAGVSLESCGIDCSGFVSRCWGLSRPYSTKELPKISERIEWDELKPGDILLNDRHVVLFIKWKVEGKELTGYDAGPFPVWSVHPCGLSKNALLKEGYAPWRYKHIVEEKWQAPAQVIPPKKLWIRKDKHTPASMNPISGSSRNFWVRDGY
ncbi:MAG: hypothetical protein QM680_07610 [Luteolibacter sp.]